MSQQEATPGPDPSMEDILASIRRILNDDEAEPAAAAPIPPAHTPPAGAAPAGAPGGRLSDDDVFLLDQTMLIEEPPAMPPEPEPEPPYAGAYEPPSYAAAPLHEPPVAAPPREPSYVAPPLPEPPAAPPPRETPRAAHPAADYSHLDAGEPPEEPLLAHSAAAAAGASLGALVRVVGQRNTPVYRGGPTLEDMVRDEIRPLVKTWLDENLAPMVERLVRNEIERVTRGQ